MRDLHFLAGCVIALFASSLIAQDTSIDGSAKGDASTAGQVSIKLTEVAVSPAAKEKLRSDKTDAVTRQLEALKEKGQAKVIEHFEVTALHDSTAELQVGAQAPMATGRTSQRGGGSAKSFTYQQVGVLFSCTPLIVGDHILLNFRYEKSELVGGDDQNAVPASIITTRANSTIRIPKNRSIVLSGQRIGPDQKNIKWNLIIAAHVTSE